MEAQGDELGIDVGTVGLSNHGNNQGVFKEVDAGPTVGMEGK